MRCPDCGGYLVEVTFSGIDMSYRCFTCGGVFLHGKTVDGLPEEALRNWNEVQVDPEVLRTGDNNCPRDATRLTVYAGEAVPEDIVVRRCEVCRWWWFPTDSLFKFKPRQAANIKRYGPGGMLGTAAAITASIMVLTAISGAVFMRQGMLTSADVGITHFSATYLGDGRELVGWQTDGKVDRMVIRRSDGKWTDLATGGQACVNNKCLMEISSLQEGWEYELTIAGKTYKFQTKL